MKHPQEFNIMGYYTSKGGVIQMARALAVELAPHKIRVNSIAPGFVSTAYVSPYDEYSYAYHSI